jgi:molybdenum-dependent DNA-binding transcriptional regulator ModE
MTELLAALAVGGVAVVAIVLAMARGGGGGGGTIVGADLVRALAAGNKDLTRKSRDSKLDDLLVAKKNRLQKRMTRQ